MADNYLITGYWGEPHVTAENDRGINAATFGTGRFVLPVGEQFKAEYIGNNTIRLYDGKLIDNGAAAGIPVGEYVDLLIANAGQGMNRNDLIVFQYSQDASTLVESGIFVVVQGTETDGEAYDPDLTQEDLLPGEAAFDQMALWRVSVSGTAISDPVKLFSIESPFPASGGTMSGNIDMDGHKLSGLGDPEADGDAVPKSYLMTELNGRTRFNRLDYTGTLLNALKNLWASLPSVTGVATLVLNGGQMHGLFYSKANDNYGQVLCLSYTLSTGGVMYKNNGGTWSESVL